MEITEEEQREIVDPLTEVCQAFGYAMRHTMINHKTKSEKGWAIFASCLARFMKLVD